MLYLQHQKLLASGYSILQQAVITSPSHSGRATMNIQLVEDVIDMTFHRAYTEDKAIGDLLV